ncbi:MAG TPA: cyclic nucleotide-binding domain-containing protein [Burkholderiales bacterium]|jgi:CRP-like cAMP-binding protein|nr:cyclic nucleotide-binding domain-containing protein [Burkholderiales bacterium]
MASIEEELQAGGLQVLGSCRGLVQRDAALLDDFSADEAETLGSVMLRVRAKPGQILIQEGAVGDWMMLLLSGTVDVTKLSEQGVPSRIAVIKSGASIGEMSMLDGAPRYATCAALQEVEAGVLTRQAIGRLIREHPAVGAKLLVKLTQLLAQRLRNTGTHLIKARIGAAPGATPAEKAGLKRRSTDWP